MQSMVMQFVARDGRPFILRPAQPQDASGILQTLREVGAEEIYLAAEEPRWRRQDVLEMIHDMSYYPFILVAEANERVIGHCFVQRGSLKKNQHTASLGMLVIASHRSVGIGTAILEYIETWARVNGLEKLFLSVFSSNRRAIDLYERSGFIREGVRPGQFIIHNQPISEIVMGKPLTANLACCYGDLSDHNAKV
jgi:RimJ/RimL family protein N-acetyltransferase